MEKGTYTILFNEIKSSGHSRGNAMGKDFVKFFVLNEELGVTSGDSVSCCLCLVLNTTTSNTLCIDYLRVHSGQFNLYMYVFIIFWISVDK